MKIILRTSLVAVIALAGVTACQAPLVWAEEGEGFQAVVTDKATKTECSACHMAFPPVMLPAQSWQTIMDGLDNHFGENASLDDKLRQNITDYLVNNAGRFRYDEKALRITETRWWVAAHEGEVRPGAFNSPRVGSKANCVACHRGAERGYYEDD